MLPDISEIGEFDYSWDFDKDEYHEWLQENEMEENEDSLMEYINDNVTFDMDFLDNDTFHSFAFQTMSLSEIEDEYGEELSRKVLSDCMEDDHGRCETMMLNNDEIDVNNPDELNARAKQLLRHGEYYKDCRGFILTDGTVVYTPSEHNECSRIYGVKGTFHFISLGNIRVLPNSIDIGKQPTDAQEQVLANVISLYANDTLYLDIMDKGSEFGTTYNNPQWRYVLNEIRRYYREGIRPQGRNFYESKMKKKTIIIDEDRQQEIIGKLLQEAFYPNADKVLYIKDYMDKNFSKQELDSIDANGYPTKEKTVVMMSKEKQPLKTLSMKEFLRLLDDKFHSMITKDEDRKKFLKQVITDWYYDRISNDGILSVNHL